MNVLFEATEKIFFSSFYNEFQFSSFFRSQSVVLGVAVAVVYSSVLTQKRLVII